MFAKERNRNSYKSDNKAGRNILTRRGTLNNGLLLTQTTQSTVTLNLRDNGDDGTIDMIQINNYDTIVAYALPTTTDYRITDKLVTGNYFNP